MRPLAGAMLVLAAAGCVPADPRDDLSAPEPRFDALAFFAGASQGEGTLRIVARGAQRVRVSSRGSVQPDGTLRLDQVVRRGDAAPTRRHWLIRRVGAERYAGTLSDAAGPVTGETRGNRLHLSFRMKGGAQAEQWLYLRRDGQVAQNRMVVRKWGMPVASLDETIRRRR